MYNFSNGYDNLVEIFYLFVICFKLSDLFFFLNP